MPRERVASVDALRALALLPVVVVNALTYAEMPGGGFFPSLAQATAADVAALLLVATLLQGKGIVLLMFLFGYSLTWSRSARLRVRRLLPLGLLHGTLLYLGDIVHQYALLGAWTGRSLRWSGSRLRRAVCVWATVWVLFTGLLAGAMSAFSDDAVEAGPRLVAASTWSDWLRLNASSFWADWAWGLIGLAPMALALMYLGVLAGRLRWLHHRRWRAHWGRWARWAPWTLLLNLGYATWTVVALRHVPADALNLLLWMGLIGPLTLATWVPWLLLNVSWPTGLVRAGQNTLSMYVGASGLIVLLLAGPALAWRPSVVALTLAAVAVWGGLAATSAWAAGHGRRLPLEAWVARGARA